MRFLNDEALSFIKNNESDFLKACLSKLIGKILTPFQWNIKAILVYGSVATGEYSSFPMDIDIMVVSRFYDPFLFWRIKSIVQKAPIKIEVNQISLAEFNKLKTMEVIDAKNTGIVVYGDKAVLRKMTTDCVYRYEGIKILFNFGVMRQIRSMSKDVLKTQILSKEQEKTLLVDYVKAYQGTCACLLVLRGKYRLGYEERANYFCKIYPEEFPSLHQKIPDLPDKIKFANSLKRSSFKYHGNVKDLWFQTKRDVQVVLSFALAEFFGQPQDKSLLNNILLLNRFPHDMRNSMIYAFRLFLYQKAVPPPTIIIVDAVSRMYIAGTCILFSVDSSLNFDEMLLQTAEKSLKQILRIHVDSDTSPIDRWEEIRRNCASLSTLVSQWHMDKDPFNS